MLKASALADFDCAAILADFDGTLDHRYPVRLLMDAALPLFGAVAISALRRFRQEHARHRAPLGGVSANRDPASSPFRHQLVNSAANSDITPEQMEAVVDEWMFRRPRKWLHWLVRWPLVRGLQARQSDGIRLALVSDYPVRFGSEPSATGRARMTKSDLIGSMTRGQRTLSERNVEFAFKAMLQQMSDALASGERIEIRGLGSFALHSRPPRVGRNPKTGETVAVPARYVPHSKPGKELRERVNAAMDALTQRQRIGASHG